MARKSKKVDQHHDVSEFEQGLIRSMEQAVAIATGTAKPAKAYTRQRTAHDVTVREAPQYDERAFLEKTGQLGPFVESVDVDGGVGPLPK